MYTNTHLFGHPPVETFVVRPDKAHVQARLHLRVRRQEVHRHVLCHGVILTALGGQVSRQALQHTITVAVRELVVCV